MSLSYHLHPHFFYEDVTIADETQNAPRYNGIPKQVSRKDFNRYILPHLWHNRWSKMVLMRSSLKHLSYIFMIRTNLIPLDFMAMGQYRQLALSYDKLKETRLGFRNLAYSLINFRVTFNDS